MGQSFKEPIVLGEESTAPSGVLLADFRSLSYAHSPSDHCHNISCQSKTNAARFSVLSLQEALPQLSPIKNSPR